MKRLVVSTGDDPLTKPVVDYLGAKYGIPKDHIQHIVLDAEVNQPQTITVTLFVEEDK